MVIPNTTCDQTHKTDNGILLLKKVNGILRIINEHEFVNNPGSIKHDLIRARTGYLNAWLNETKEDLYNTFERNEARLILEAHIERFEDFIREETAELIQEYVLL